MKIKMLRRLKLIWFGFGYSFIGGEKQKPEN